MFTLIFPILSIFHSPSTISLSLASIYSIFILLFFIKRMLFSCALIFFLGNKYEFVLLHQSQFWKKVLCVLWIGLFEDCF